jgi:hypothetical protein
MALMGNSSQLCLRLQLLIDSLPCFTTLFQGYHPLHADITSPLPDPELEPASFSCEPFDGLKLLFKKKIPTDTAKSPL